MKKNNVILEKSYAFALRIVKLSQFLISEKKEFVISRQILKSGTSIGANAEEAVGGQSEKDFYAKFTIAYKETRETKYWIRLLRDSEIIEKNLSESLLKEIDEILRIIGKIQTTVRKKQLKDS